MDFNGMLDYSLNLSYICDEKYIQPNLNSSNMKNLNYLFLLLVSSLFIFSCGGNTSTEKVADTKAPTTQEVSKKSVANRIEVLDFYGTHRCVTCKAIEANTKYTLETYFPDELKSGKIVFKTINVDDEANAKLAEQFEAAGTALFLNTIKDGKETHVNLTNQAFEKGRDKDAFSDELKFFIDLQLKEI